MKKIGCTGDWTRFISVMNKSVSLSGQIKLSGFRLIGTCIKFEEEIYEDCSISGYLGPNRGHFINANKLMLLK